MKEVFFYPYESIKNIFSQIQTEIMQKKRCFAVSVFFVTIVLLTKGRDERPSLKVKQIYNH